MKLAIALVLLSLAAGCVSRAQPNGNNGRDGRDHGGGSTSGDGRDDTSPDRASVIERDDQLSH